MRERILGALRQHERALEGARTGEVFDARMRTMIATHRPASFVGLWAVAAGLALLALGLGLARLHVPAFEGGDPPPEAVSRLGGATGGERACHRDFEGGTIELDGRCRLEIEGPGITVETWTRARIEPRADGLFVHDGLVLLEVEKVRPGARPVRVGVPGGTIEVVGTQFVVYQGGAGGEVELIEGKIRFAHGDGNTVEMQVGDRLRWAPSAGPAPGPEPESAPEPAPALVVEPGPPPASPADARPRARRRPTRPAAKSSSEPPAAEVDLNAALARVAQLREARRYDAALAEIRALGGRAGLPVGIAELVSFEEGSLLEAKGSAGVACRHWASHAGRFPAGRYASEVLRHRSELQCEGDR